MRNVEDFQGQGQEKNSSIDVAFPQNSLKMKNFAEFQNEITNLKDFSKIFKESSKNLDVSYLSFNHYFKANWKQKL